MPSRLHSLVKSPICRLVAAVTLGVAILLIWRPPFTEFLELKFYDLKFRFRGDRPPGPEVVIVAVDDPSLKEVGRWPWSREEIARLLQQIKASGPRVIAVDIIFAEKQEISALCSLENLRREISRQGLNSPRILAVLDQEQRRADVDRLLAKAVAQPPPTVLGFFFREVGGRPGRTAEELLDPSVVKVSTYNLVRSLDAAPSRIPLIGAVGVELNLPEIAAGAAGGGYFNMIPDSDGTIRWLPMTIAFGPDFFAPMALVSLACYLGQSPLAVTLSRLGVEEIRLGSRPIAVDRFGRLLINYLGPPGLIPTYSAAAVLKGSLPSGVLKDKIVLVGATAVGIYDLRVTPFSGVCPGTEIQATVMDNLLHGTYLRTPPFVLPVMLAVLLLLGTMLALVLPMLSAVWAFVFALALSGAYIVSNYLLFSRLRWQLDLFYPLVQIAGVYTGITIQRFLAEGEERRRIKKAFQSYVAPEVVNEILKYPERLHLGGERRELTILFSDIRGFTALAESLEPETLVAWLHDFLNPMSEIIVQHQGTIDKYIGDAIMALFGAPLACPDHASLACRTALAMVARLKDLSREWERQGRPGMKIGVGINSGPVSVGNMGSDRLFTYTAIGDNVNLTSRLEGLNKFYGTEILLSTGTAQAVQGEFILREVDLVQVKGKTRPLVVHELLGEGTPLPDLTRFLETYREGRLFFKARRFAESARAFAAALQLRPQDRPSRDYLELSERYRSAPPGPEWQGVRVMEEK